jgi:nucleotidyltransferase substrate binding protein (TIGR01987 family)
MRRMEMPMSSQDIRWIQRYKHFVQAFTQLEKAVALSKQRPLTELEKQGLIQGFEYTHELAWNVLKDFLEEQGMQNLYGSKDTTREAFRRGLVENGANWMDMIKNRNLTSRTYNSEVTQQIVRAIVDDYYTEFRQLLARLKPPAEEARR